MKKSYIYILASLLAFAGVSCNSDDPTDASSKHEYAEGEAPYLRSNAAATTALNMEFQVVKIDQPQYIYLKDYAPVFHKNLNMTVDEAIAAVENGSAIFTTIKTARQCWDLTPSNYGEYGWYYAANGLGTADDAVFTMNFDKDNKVVEIKAVGVPAVGTMSTIDFGIALKKDAAFDDYVRFSVLASVTDPSKVVMSANIPGEGYGTYSINLKDYADSFMLSMGMTVDEVIKALDNNQIDVYLCDADGNRVLAEDGSRPAYTSGALGYWLDPEGKITGWNGNGYPANMMFLEYGGGGVYNLGNADGSSLTPKGTQTTVRFDFVSVDDPTSFLQFIVAVTFD
jgi:hypothetical protein